MARKTPSHVIMCYQIFQTSNFGMHKSHLEAYLKFKFYALPSEIQVQFDLVEWTEMYIFGKYSRKLTLMI